MGMPQSPNRVSIDGGIRCRAFGSGMNDSWTAGQQADVTLLPISCVRRDGGTQPRVAISARIGAECAVLMRQRVAFPPIRVWWDGNDYWLSDGFHRVAAAEKAGIAEIAAEVHLGTLNDARWDSYAANTAAGLRRAAADVRLILQRALTHPNAAVLSTVQIAQHLRVPETTVRRWRRLSSPRGEDSIRVVTRGGTSYVLRVANIGHRPRKQSSVRRDLRAELTEMKRIGSAAARPVLNIISHWVLGAATPRECVAAIELFVGHQNCPNRPLGAPEAMSLPGWRAPQYRHLGKSSENQGKT